MNGPTPEDLARDLAADLGLTAGFPPDECPWGEDTFSGRACVGWPAAIRRALAAEARAAGLEAEVAALKAQLAAACDRVAAQSDLPSRRAEAETDG